MIEQIEKFRALQKLEPHSGTKEYRRLAGKIRYLKFGDEVRKYERERRNNPEVREKCRLYQNKRLNENPIAREKARTRSEAYYKANYKQINKKRRTPHHSKARGFMRLIQITIEKANRGIFPEFFGFERSNIRGPRPTNIIARGTGLESLNHFRLNFESKFQTGMTWRNYGIAWWIGHRKPVRSFDCTIEAEFLECFHHTNIFPECVADNLKRVNEVKRFK